MSSFLGNQRIVPRPTRTAADIDADGLARYLRRRMRGEVRFDAGMRAIYSTAAANYRLVPIGVVVPMDVDEIETAMEGCHRFGAPVLFRGGAPAWLARLQTSRS
jgi:hypothetical protein